MMIPITVNKNHKAMDIVKIVEADDITMSTRKKIVNSDEKEIPSNSCPPTQEANTKQAQS